MTKEKTVGQSTVMHLIAYSKKRKDRGRVLQKPSKAIPFCDFIIDFFFMRDHVVFSTGADSLAKGNIIR